MTSSQRATPALGSMSSQTTRSSTASGLQTPSLQVLLASSVRASQSRTRSPDFLNAMRTDAWNHQAHKMTKNAFGVWELTIPPVDGQPAIPHDTMIKVRAPPLVSLHLLTVSTRSR